MNVDGIVNALDITDFVRAITGQTIDTAYKADMNNDGLFNAQDIHGFIVAMTALQQATATSVAAPEPSTLALLIAATLVLRRNRGYR